MAWTRFYSPTSVRQLESNEIQMQSYGTRGITAFQSIFPVRSISTSFGTFTREESNSLVFTGFGMPSVIPLGIQARLVTQRLARIQDKVIQLWDGAQTIGENKQNLRAENDQLYGGDWDRWGLKSDYGIPTASPDFGIVIDLQPHTEIPCSDTVYIRSVSMRLYLPE